jgi:hypothetical protein
MSLFSRSSRSLFRRAWKPLHFPSKGFNPLPAVKKLEEETIPDYVASHFYPVRIGEILRARYQVVGKLGFGITSTVWLARDLRCVLLFVAVSCMPAQFSRLANVGTLLSNSSSVQKSWELCMMTSSICTSRSKSVRMTIQAAVRYARCSTPSTSTVRTGDIVVPYTPHCGRHYLM